MSFLHKFTPRFNSLASAINRTRSRFTSTVITSPSSTSTSSPLSALRNHLLDNPNGSGRRIVGYWLAGCTGAVFGIIVFGGLTRLTESGLSMVDWKLIHFKAPQNQSEWQAYFALYQQYPEYQV